MTAKQMKEKADNYNKSFYNESTFKKILKAIETWAENGEYHLIFKLSLPNSTAAKPYVLKLEELGYDCFILYSTGSDKIELEIRWEEE